MFNKPLFEYKDKFIVTKRDTISTTRPIKANIISVEIIKKLTYCGSLYDQN